MHLRGAEFLTYEKAAALCRRFVPAGEEVFEHIHRLSSMEFKVFIPHCAFIDSYAETEHELKTHRQCAIESAKVLLSRPWPMRFSRPEYHSELFEVLGAARDRENGVPFNELNSRFLGKELLWRRELDPVKRKMLYAAVTQPEDYNRRLAEVRAEQKRRMQLEVMIHSGRANIVGAFDRAKSLEFYGMLMEREAGKVGFKRDERRWNPRYPVFSKAISKHWVLCWAIEDRAQFLGTAENGFFEPSLELRHQTMARHIDDAQIGEFLLIRYEYVVPEFRRSYWKFFDLNELEVMIKAHLSLYSCLAVLIEAAVKAELS